MVTVSVHFPTLLYHGEVYVRSKKKKRRKVQRGGVPNPLVFPETLGLKNEINASTTCPKRVVNDAPRDLFSLFTNEESYVFGLHLLHVAKGMFDKNMYYHSFCLFMFTYFFIIKHVISDLHEVCEVPFVIYWWCQTAEWTDAV